MKKPTIKDVAKAANVSVATVSRVLNNMPGFSTETENNVRKAMISLGYQYNIIARNLKKNKTNTIAVLIPQVETTFYVKILNGIQESALKHKYNIIVCYVGIAGNQTDEYIKMLLERQVDGIIGCSLPPDEKIDSMMEKCGIPCILVSTLSTKYAIPYIRVDDRKAEYAATKYLIDKGHRNIAFLAGSNDDLVAGTFRLEGFKNALKDNNIPFTEDCVYYTRFNYETSLQASKELFSSKKKYTGIVACCDETAIAAIATAYKLGLKVPEDFSIIGYDNTRVAEMAIPPLTTISQPLYDMGNQAFEMILKKIEEGKKIESKVMPFEIVERDTVKEI